MRYPKVASGIAIMLVACLASPIAVLASVSNIIHTTIPEEVTAENSPTLSQWFRIYIENFKNGTIDYVDNSGNHTKMGTVLRPAAAVVDASDGFWASHYDKASDGTHGCVTATAVNAIHLRVGPETAYDPLNPTAWTPKLLSLGIKELYDHAGGSYSDGTIYTDIPGGSMLFGGWDAPFVGSPVKYYTGREWRPIGEYFQGDYTKKPPMRLLIVVERPTTDRGVPDYLEFENWAAGDTVQNIAMTANGRVLMHYPDGTTIQIADVIQRVCGTGRFGGTEYAEVGRIRANHPGVLCFSTSPKVGYTTNIDERGGFQIVPANHAKYLYYNLNQTQAFIDKPQWMIVAQVGADRSLLQDSRYVISDKLSYDPAWEAVAPVFGMYLRPKHIPGYLDSTTYFEISRDFGVTWESCPSIQGVTDPTTGSDVEQWTNIRVHLGD